MLFSLVRFNDLQWLANEISKRWRLEPRIFVQEVWSPTSLVPFLGCSPQQTLSGVRELTTYNIQTRLTELFGCLQTAGSISSGSEIPLNLLSLLLLSLFLSLCIIAMQSFTLYFCFPSQAFITQGNISKQCLWKLWIKSSQPHFLMFFLSIGYVTAKKKV